MPIDKRRVPLRSPRAYEIKTLQENHHIIKRLIFSGQTNRDIASVTGLTKEQISKIRNSEVLKVELAILREAADIDSLEVVKHIHRLVPEALEVMEEAMDEDVAINIRLRSATDVLDRAGYAPVSKMDVAHVHAHLTDDDVKMLKERARASGIIVPSNGEAKSIEDVEFVEEKI